MSDKMAYAKSADPDQTAPKGQSDRVYTVCHSTKHFKRQLSKKQNLRLKKNVWNKVFEILGHLP